MSDAWAGWPSSANSDEDESDGFDADLAGPEYHAWLDAQRASSGRSTADQAMIVTEGAARAIEKGERVESLKLTLKRDSLVLEAPDHVWFHLLRPLDAEASAGCAACRELTEVLARVLFTL